MDVKEGETLKARPRILRFVVEMRVEREAATSTIGVQGGVRESRWEGATST